MALITRVMKEETRAVSVKLEISLAERLGAYAGFLNRTRDEIVALALDHAIWGDKEFMATQGRLDGAGNRPLRKRLPKTSGEA